MGEVYRAHDGTLKRSVALKVLPSTLFRDHERMARFQREAEVLASLDHPNIGHIYGIVDSGDSRGLVLALIDGRPSQSNLEHKYVMATRSRILNRCPRLVQPGQPVTVST